MTVKKKAPDLKLKFDTFIEPFTPDRPTHPCENTEQLIAFIKALDSQMFYANRAISVKEYQDGIWVAIASRFNSIWYGTSGKIKV